MLSVFPVYFDPFSILVFLVCGVVGLGFLVSAWSDESAKEKGKREEEKKSFKTGAVLEVPFDPDSDYVGADMRNKNLTGANLSKINLRGADMSGAKLISADLSDALLGGANFHNANLTNANLRGAHLVNANLTYADLSGANLTGAILKGAIMPFGWKP